MLEAHREKPGVIHFAARRANVVHRTAKKAYLVGWERPGWARAIRDVIKDEENSARAILYREEAQRAKASAANREEMQVARMDAAQERAREAQAVRASLSNALSLMANLGAFSKASIALSHHAANQILAEIQKPKPAITWREAINFLTKLSLVGERATSQLKETMTALRLHLGVPEQLIGIVDQSGPTILVDGQTAVQALGEEKLRQAVIDLASGNITPDVDRLLAWQVVQQARPFAPSSGGGNA